MGLNLFFSAKVRWILRPILVLFAAYTLVRLVFLGYYLSVFSSLSPAEWWEFASLSLRFDASAIFSINLVFIIILLIPLRFPQGFWVGYKLVFVLANWVFIVLNVADIPYYQFNTRRTSLDVLINLMEDIGRQLPQLMLNFWPYTLLALASLFPLWISFPKKNPAYEGSVLSNLFTLIFCGLISVGLIRNSFTLKPLLPGNAFVFSNPQVGHGALNTPFVLFKATDEVALPDEKWLNDREMSRQLPQTSASLVGSCKGYNVVVIILESFSTEYTGLEGNPQSYTPFLDSLARANLWFPHHFASGRTSRDAVPSVLGSLPSWMPESFAHSRYISTKLEGLATVLKQKGYTCRFFHGGKNGTMSFDISSKICGFDSYYGLNEYKGPDSDNDGHWGVFDGPMLRFMADQSSKGPMPFLSCIFTLSSHQPYKIPESLTGKFPTGPLEILPSIGYADYSLKQFFQYAKGQSWYNKTLFVLTADHTQLNFDPRYEGIKGRFDVPLVFVAPGMKLQADTGRFVKHIDIRPSILDLLGVKEDLHNPLSSSVFSAQLGCWPMVFQDNWYYLFHPKGTLSWAGIRQDSDWNWLSDDGSAEPEGLRSHMMAQLQYYRQGLIHNTLYQPWRASKP